MKALAFDIGGTKIYNAIIDENVVINATGTTGVKGKVGDSRVVVGPYAVVYVPFVVSPNTSIDT